MRCVAGGLEEIDRADDVARRVRARIRDADANVHLRGEHEHRVEAPLANEDRRLRTADVEMLEARARGNVRALAVRKIVDDHHVVIRGEQRLGDVGPDESGAAGDERAACQGIFAVTRAFMPWATPACRVRIMIAPAPHGVTRVTWATATSSSGKLDALRVHTAAAQQRHLIARHEAVLRGRHQKQVAPASRQDGVVIEPRDARGETELDPRGNDTGGLPERVERHHVLTFEHVFEFRDELRARAAVRAPRDQLDDAGRHEHLSLPFDQAVESIDEILVADLSRRVPRQMHEHRLEVLNRTIGRRHADSNGLRGLLERACVTRTAGGPDERRCEVFALPYGRGPRPEVERLPRPALDDIGIGIEDGHAAPLLLTLRDGGIADCRVLARLLRHQRAGRGQLERVSPG